MKRPRGLVDAPGEGADEEGDMAALPEVDPITINPAYVEQWITAQYEERQFARSLDNSDLEMLTAKAGVVPGALEVSRPTFDDFKSWFRKVLRMLKHT